MELMSLWKQSYVGFITMETMETQRCGAQTTMETQTQ